VYPAMNQQEGITTDYPNLISQDKELGIPMIGFDFDFWGRVTRAATFTLGMVALIIMVLVLGLVALNSWEAESLLHCSPWSTPSSPCGQF
jgi:hypothetical protein